MTGRFGDPLGGPVTLRLLGPVEAHQGPRLVSLTPAQVRLLTALVCGDGRSATIGRIEAALWSAAAPATARKSIQNQVARLRAALGPEVVEWAPPDAYRLTLPTLDVDLDGIAALGEVVRDQHAPTDDRRRAAESIEWLWRAPDPALLDRVAGYAEAASMCHRVTCEALQTRHSAE